MSPSPAEPAYASLEGQMLGSGGKELGEEDEELEYSYPEGFEPSVPPFLGAAPGKMSSKSTVVVAIAGVVAMVLVL